MAFTLLQHLLSMVQAKLVAGSRKSRTGVGGRHDGREPQHELAEGGSPMNHDVATQSR
jgi:hypothetical protein